MRAVSRKRAALAPQTGIDEKQAADSRECAVAFVERRENEFGHAEGRFICILPVEHTGKHHGPLVAVRQVDDWEPAS